MTRVLVLYYSRNGSTDALARQAARGVGSVDGVEALLLSSRAPEAQLRGRARAGEKRNQPVQLVR